METKQQNNQNMDKYFFRASAEDFKKIPGAPLAYWFSGNDFNAFSGEKIEKYSNVCIGMKTGENEKFIRAWYEISNSKIGFYLPTLIDANNSCYTWFPYLKGGDYRRWHGNYELILNWINYGENIKNHVNKHGVSDSRLRPSNYDFYFSKGLNWSFITSGNFGVRLHDNGFFFDVAGSSLFAKEGFLNAFFVGYLNSKVASRFLSALNPTLNMQIENIKALPVLRIENTFKLEKRVLNLKSRTKQDWDSYETSWDFTSLPLLQTIYSQSIIQSTYQTFRSHWQKMTLEMQQLEEENNRIFIEAYGLGDELTPEVPLKEITLTCNPYYRYNGKKSDAELEKLLLADTMKEYISYAVGCMFGRYSLDKEGLILANQGDTLQEYLSQVPDPKFMPDEDNVIPILDDNWFVDDIVDRFYVFLRVTFGIEHFNENLQFIEDSIGKSVRNYFVSDFYTDHVKRYKKRPIYWMFSSPKGSFNVLIYLHRYNEDTVSTILNNYLREFQNKLKAYEIQLQELSESSTARQGDKTKALKEIQKVRRTLDEILQWERNVIYPLATQRIAIDLDDGVKVNYAKFAGAVKKIAGLN